MSMYKCVRCEETFSMNKPTNFALALREHHDCDEYEYEDDDDGVLAKKIPISEGTTDDESEEDEPSDDTEE